MKSLTKLLFTFLFLVLTNLVSAQAQSAYTSPELSKKELKAISSLEKAKSDYEQSKNKLASLRNEYDKKRKKFEKQNSKGKLSPTAVSSHTKILDKLSKKISKEMATLQKLEKYIQLNETKL